MKDRQKQKGFVASGYGFNVGDTVALSYIGEEEFKENDFTNTKGTIKSIYMGHIYSIQVAWRIHGTVPMKPEELKLIVETNEVCDE